MNTIRFFLLLVSIFFFAFLFQTNAKHRIGQRGEVLSQDSSKVNESFFTNDDSIYAIFSYYHYPGSTLLSSSDSETVYESHDAAVSIVAWYRELFIQNKRYSNFSNSRNQTVITTTGPDGKEITLTVKQIEDKQCLIFVRVTAT